MKELLTSLGVTNVENLDLGPLTLEAVLVALFTLVVCLIAIKLVLSIFRKLLTRPSIEERVRRYALGAIRIALWIVTILIVADALGIPITSLVALLSVFSLAISLAVQSVLGNIAGGIVIMLNKPFHEGDFVETSSGTGTVRDITLNYTYLESADGQRIVVPNSTLASDRIINYSVLDKRRVTVTVTASYDAPTETVRQACLDAVARIPEVLQDPAPEVLLTNYGQSSIEYKVRVWCKPAHYGDVLFPLTEYLRDTFQAAGVEMTYDHLNIHILDK